VTKGIGENDNEESLRIPYETSPLEGARILVLAAHPDDEVLGAGGTLALNANRAEAIRVWVATDGQKQERAAGSDEEYRARRREESRRAARVLGIAEPVFGAMPDRELASRREELRAELLTQVREFSPDLILCPSPVEIHPDHRALAETLYELVAGSRLADPDHDRLRFARMGFYELTHPLLPNTLVDIASVAAIKREALGAFVSQQQVRDYAGAIDGLNVYRRLTVPGAGPAEAFRVIAQAEASTRSLEEFRRSIGPSVVTDGERGPAPVSVVVRTRNRPALLQEALDSLRCQTARPHEVVVVNDGGASLGELASSYLDSFSVVVEEGRERRGRSAAANLGLELATSELVAFLDDDDLCYPDHVERLVRAHRQGPQPVVYSDAVTVLYTRGSDGWETRHRELQYSLDFDPDYLLLANYIPLHTLLAPRDLCRRAGAFDVGLEYSEDWDLLIRLSFETPFRHIRAVTCEYRVFEESAGEPAHVAAGGAPFIQARETIYNRYAHRRNPEGLGRVLDRMRVQIARLAERDGIAQGELRYQRESHRKLNLARERAERELGQLQSERANAADARSRLARLEAERSQLLAENELVHARVGELFAANEKYSRELFETRTEVDRLSSILHQIYGSRTWRLHLLLDRIRGRR
jgi:LmbE family N-acetylglucosaminyl deacetylase/glycosyltransferase involved in cell wall biosynthesis